ncbi:Lrp/AsnC family transcriptional regulator [Candidatus Woesearchaeota archaeon]|nr:Lrp/AsnC family transcriptional regulator [Candidatus Woesearchaeota archaeon]
MVKRITENEKKVLKKLIDQGRVTDTNIADDLKISQQAVFQIRNRLEEMGIIKGYMPIIDFEKVGISLMNFVGIKVLPDMWKKFTEAQLNEKLYEVPFLFVAFRVPSSDISYLLITGFKDIKEEEEFAKKLETILTDKIEVVWAYRTAVDNMIAYDSLNLVYHALRKKDINIKDAVESITKE